jgi:transcriptional repressor NrdR
VKCPYCAHLEDKVVDSRSSKSGDAIRRRRECLACGKRFTTYEQLEDMLPVVAKKDGRREPFERVKILSGLRKACEKRPVSEQTLEGLADEVAYVRFASVYRQFKDVRAFSDELKRFMSRFDDRDEGKGKG